MTAQRDLAAAHQAFKAEQFAEAEALCVAIIEDNPDFGKAHQLLALIALKTRDLDKAHKAILEAARLTPGDAEIHNTRGNILKYKGQIKAAIGAYEESLKIAPNYIPASQNLGELYLHEKNPLKALSVFESALAHAPDHPVMMQGLLYALKDAQQTDAALGVLQKMPQSPAAALAAGQLFAANGQTFQAKNAFVQALSHPPTAAMAFRNLVQIAWMKDGIDAGRAEIDGMVKAAPKAGFLYTEGAELLAHMGDIDGGFALLAQSEEAFGAVPELDVAKAKLHIRRNDGEVAFALSESALKAQQGNPAFLPDYARAALMTGRFDVALDAAKHMQNMMPDNQFWIAIEATAKRGLGQDYQSLYDYDRFVRPYDLDPPPEYDSLGDFLSQLKPALDERHGSNHFPLAQSLRGGTQTPADLRFAGSRVIQDFFQALATPIQDYMSVIGDASGHPLTRRNTKKYRLSGAWSVRLSGDGFHVNHVHPEGWISSAFYVDVPDGTADDPDQKGWIKFGEPPFDVPGQSFEHVIAPKAGRLVLFPSYMWHGTIPIANGASRMTLPFDAVPA